MVLTILLAVFLVFYFLLGLLTLLISIVDYANGRVRVKNESQFGIVWFFVKILFCSPALVIYYKIKSLFKVRKVQGEVYEPGKI